MDKFTKIMPGYVRQYFERGPGGKFVCVSQDFVADDGGESEFIDADGFIDPPDYEYQSYDMVVARDTAGDDIDAAKDENEKHNKPCPHTPGIMCVQHPMEDCGCDYCGECKNGPGISNW